MNEHYEMQPELKVLKAELIRQEFEKYLDSEHFRLLTLEKNIDDVWKQARNQINRYDSERNINTFISILNYFLWHTKYQQDKDKFYYNNFTSILYTILIGYYYYNNKPDDYLKIIRCLNKISTLEKSDIEKFEVDLKSFSDKKNEELDIVKIKYREGTHIEKPLSVTNSYQIDYAIITALEEDEMEKVLPFINIISEIENSKNFIEIGELKNRPDKKIVFASQHNTGMVDASILASELILTFKPKFLIMVGVLGGKPEETNIGDVIIATKVFEVDRGKESKLGFRNELSVSAITNKEIKKIVRKKKDLESHLNSSDETRNTNIKLHFGPIACVNQVIDLPGYFDEKITSIDRKAIALEMESFAIVRACELLNDGKTTPLIIKSVMDNTQNKVDNAKPYAAWTSAKTLEYILTNDII